jgi:hypothetical protein
VGKHELRIVHEKTIEHNETLGTPVIAFSRRTAASLNSFVNNLRGNPMTQSSFGWI